MTTSNETKAAAMGSELAAFSMRTVMTRLFQLLFSMLYSAMLTYAYRVSSFVFPIGDVVGDELPQIRIEIMKKKARHNLINAKCR